MERVALCVGAALLGAIPFALLLGRVLGVDIRTVGSGNVGATNLARAKGLPWGGLAFLLDAAKGFLPAWLAGLWFPADLPWLPATAGGVAVLGHCFSPYLRFRGGKGVATAAGALAALELPLIGALLGFWVLVGLCFRNIGIASAVAAVVAGGLGLWRWSQGITSGVPPQLLIALALVILVRHWRNLRAYLFKTEGRAPMESKGTRP